MEKRVNMKTEYVVGFAFHLDHVLLIRKKRPKWQENRLNGIGGHIEKGEAPIFAMAREFFEETGIITGINSWRLFATVEGKDWRVHFFRATIEIEKANATTDEPLELHFWNHLPDDTIVNLHWLIPLALSRDNGKPMYIYEISARLEADTDPISMNVAKKILAARDALIHGNLDEAYHQLYAIASPHFDKREPWKKLEDTVDEKSALTDDPTRLSGVWEAME
jgi:8-oxo-dGTP diphosphatase